MLDEIELTFDPASDEAVALHAKNKETTISNSNRSSLNLNPPIYQAPSHGDATNRNSLQDSLFYLTVLYKYLSGKIQIIFIYIFLNDITIKMK
ncbi:MAG: hypothetical protein ACYDHX_00930 [Methanothrix sp.]